jgi:hypothetical protein
MLVALRAGGRLIRESPANLFTQVRRIGILRSSHSGDSQKFVLDLLLRNVCRNAWETVVL